MRVVIIGISGAGKSTMARQLSAALGLRHIELDALFWEPGWRQARPEDFAARVEAATQGDGWVVDGNYSATRALTWGRATHLVWLDYERLPVMRRVITRSIRRAVTGQELWNGNRERWQNFFHASHPIRWAWSQWRGRRVALEAALGRGDYPRLAVTRLRHPREAAAAIAALINDRSS
ncbi:adenylate kinase [Pseudoroseomonas deserti]|uniref:Adenylate kinase n=1 Tax=Teichococcus deserti TaxID=1817963 RepID=A0A1V2GYX7_9PROT|nr:adenylate kinase [Pseudoroseomonas deserti]ONG50116.1 adenylate kinase [Pseudoroseomonas deserti]